MVCLQLPLVVGVARHFWLLEGKGIPDYPPDVFRKNAEVLLHGQPC